MSIVLLHTCNFISYWCSCLSCNSLFSLFTFCPYSVNILICDPVSSSHLVKILPLFVTTGIATKGLESEEVIRLSEALFLYSIFCTCVLGVFVVSGFCINNFPVSCSDWGFACYYGYSVYMYFVVMVFSFVCQLFSLLG